MKGIVIEIDQKDAVILSDAGLFIKMKNTGYRIGQTVKIKENRRTVSKWIVGAASMAAAMAFCTMGAFAYYTPTDYVSMDVNPSIEYSVNRFDRILDVKAMNDDGKAILSELELKNKTIQNGMKETLNQLVEDGYLTAGPDTGVVITTSNKDMKEAEQLAANLKQEVRTYLDKEEDIAAEVDAEAVALDRVDEARDLGVTPGKLNLVEKLQESTGSAISKEEWLAMPVREINKAIKENRRLEQEKEKVKDRMDGDDNDKEAVSDGIRRNSDDSINPEKEDANEHGTVKGNEEKSKQNGNQKSKQQEGVLNKTADQNADKIKEIIDSAGNQEQQNEDRNENGSRSGDKYKSDNGNSPKGNDD